MSPLAELGRGGVGAHSGEELFSTPPHSAKAMDEQLETMLGLLQPRGRHQPSWVLDGFCSHRPLLKKGLAIEGRG